MRKPKLFTVDVGDIIEHKRKPMKGEKFLVVEVQEERTFYRQQMIVSKTYIILRLKDNTTSRLYRDLSTQHWKIIG